MKSNFDKVICIPLECDDVNKTVAQLPRHPDDAQIVAVQLKRRLQLKNSYLQEYLRPKVIINGLKSLKWEFHNPHYQDIKINEDFLQKPDGDEMEVNSASQMIEKELDEEYERGEKYAKEANIAIEKEKTGSSTDGTGEEFHSSKEVEAKSGSDEESEDEHDTRLQSVKNFQSKQENNTCLLPRDMANKIVMNTEKSAMERLKEKKSIQIAPGNYKHFFSNMSDKTQMKWFIPLGEGKVPTNFLREKHFDVKAFPKYHPSGQFGLDHPRPIRLYPQMYFNQRLLNKDRRFSQDSCYLFMASYYIERLALEKQINISGNFSFKSLL